MNATKTITAKSFATGAHRGQTDKAGEPYIGHPARVAARLEQAGAPEHMVAAAWLHDVVEDTGLSLGYLRTFFDERVCRLVDLLTRREGQSYEEYLDRVATSPEAITIKLADIADNTDPNRLLALGEDEALRLALKYVRALGRLTRSPNYAGS